MGGNARYINRSTGQDLGFAEKIDLTKIPRAELVKEATTVLETINKEYFTLYGKKLWNNFNVITSGKALNGSSESLFNKDITDDEFINHKPSVGDIDITFPYAEMGNLWHLLNSLEGSKLSNSISYLGHKNSNIDPTKANNLNQINAVFKLDTPNYTTNIQIDFEASEYENDEPTDWASFSHNSDWEDIKNGYKGVMHKFILINLSRAASKMEGVKVVTATQVKKITDTTFNEYQDFVKNKITKHLAKVSIKKDFINPTNLAFSVDRGMRLKFIQLHHKDGKPAEIDGNPVFAFVEPKDSKYETKLEIMFTLIFQQEPKGSDMKDFRSFVGVVKLMKKYLSNKVIGEFFINHLIHKSLFAKGAQGLERNNPKEDLNIKGAMVNKLYDTFKFLNKYKDEVDEQINTYYKSYKMYDLNENEITVPSGKLSEIFESINSK